MAVPKIISTPVVVMVVAAGIGAGSVAAMIGHGAVMGTGVTIGVLQTELPALDTYIQQGSALAPGPTGGAAQTAG